MICVIKGLKFKCVNLFLNPVTVLHDAIIITGKFLLMNVIKIGFFPITCRLRDSGGVVFNHFKLINSITNNYILSNFLSNSIKLFQIKDLYVLISLESSYKSVICLKGASIDLTFWKLGENQMCVAVYNFYSLKIWLSRINYWVIWGSLSPVISLLVNIINSNCKNNFINTYVYYLL